MNKTNKIKAKVVIFLNNLDSESQFELSITFREKKILSIALLKSIQIWNTHLQAYTKGINRCLDQAFFSLISTYQNL